MTGMGHVMAGLGRDGGTCSLVFRLLQHPTSEHLREAIKHIFRLLDGCNTCGCIYNGSVVVSAALQGF